MATIKLHSIPMIGDDTQDVTILQTQLLNLGFNRGLIDGIFGKQTRKALSTFQLSRELPGSGIVGPKTIELLGLELEKIIHTNGFTALSWEYKHPERQSWSEIIFAKVEELFSTHFSLCIDMVSFRLDYDGLTEKQKINVWGELIVAICKFESGWKPTSWMIESSMSKDPVTGRTVRSEGLLQLSYQDKKNYPKLTCNFNWELDKNLGDNDATKIIFNPKYNLEFGIQILARQIQRYSLIANPKSVYWAVLNPKGKYSKIEQIKRIVQLINP